MNSYSWIVNTGEIIHPGNDNNTDSKCKKMGSKSLFNSNIGLAMETKLPSSSNICLVSTTFLFRQQIFFFLSFFFFFLIVQNNFTDASVKF